ncbi:MAG: MamI family restriction endonuclease [candidate division WOR-3 bacterium]
METFETSEDLIKECITDLFLTPKALIDKWSKITNQTSQVRIAYPGQHIASVITGIKGKGTAARGDDLSDGSEVKTCSRVDQLSECNNCGAKVLIWQKECPICKSKDFNIKTDSHWIFPITTEDELNLLLNKVPRIILLLFDKEKPTINIVRLRAWIIEPKNDYVREFFSDYFYNNFQKKSKEGKKPAPCNLHPLKYDFYLMEPKLIFHSEIDFDKKYVDIKFWNIQNPFIEKVPTHILKKEEKQLVLREEIAKYGIEEIEQKVPFVPDEKRKHLKMRKKILKTYKEKYKRR